LGHGLADSKSLVAYEASFFSTLVLLFHSLCVSIARHFRFVSARSVVLDIMAVLSHLFSAGLMLVFMFHANVAALTRDAAAQEALVLKPLRAVRRGPEKRDMTGGRCWSLGEKGLSTGVTRTACC
jgi:hypothetical protein